MPWNLALLLLLHLVPLPVHAQNLQPWHPQPWHIAPQHEQEILQWLGPLREQSVVVPPWHVADVQVTPDRLRLRLASDETTPGWWLQLQVHGQPPILDAQMPPDAPPMLVEKTLTLTKILKLPGPWEPPPPPQPHLDPPLTSPWHALLLQHRWLVLLFWLAFAVTGIRQFVRHLPPRAEILGMSALLALSLTVRLLLSPRTLLHEFYRDAPETAFFVDPSRISGYGEGLGAPVLLLDLLHHGGVQDLFTFNLLGALLSIPALMALHVALFGPSRLVWLTGLLLALLPMHVRYAMSEETWSWSLLLLCVVAVQWLGWLRENQWPRLLLVVLGLALLLELRPEWLLVPLALAGLWLQDRQPIWRRPSLWLLGLPLLAFAVWRLAVLHPASAHPLHLPWPQYYALVEPTMTTPLLTLLILAGILAMYPQHRLATWWLLAVHVGLTLLEFTYFSHPGAYAERVQIVPTALLLPFAAQAPLLLPQRQRLGIFIVTLLAVVQLIFRLHPVQRLTASQAEWQFLQETAPQLPQQFRLLTRVPDAPYAGMPDLPLVRAGRQVRMTDLVEAHRGQKWPQPGPDLLVYLGMSCWVELNEADVPRRAGIDACVAAQQHYQLEPLLVRILPPLPDPPADHVPMPQGFPVGWYRAPGLGR